MLTSGRRGLCGWLIWTCILHYGSFSPLDFAMNAFLFSVTTLSNQLISWFVVVCHFSFSSRVVWQYLLAAPGDSSYLPSIHFHHTEHAAWFEWQQPRAILAMIHWTCGFVCRWNNFVHTLQQIFCRWLPAHFVAYCCWILIQIFFYFNLLVRGSPHFNLKCSGVKWEFL